MALIHSQMAKTNSNIWTASETSMSKIFRIARKGTAQRTTPGIPSWPDLRAANFVTYLQQRVSNVFGFLALTVLPPNWCDLAIAHAHTRYWVSTDGQGHSPEIGLCQSARADAVAGSVECEPDENEKQTYRRKPNERIEHVSSPRRLFCRGAVNALLTRRTLPGGLSR